MSENKVINAQTDTPKKQSAFKRWTEKNAQLWQLIKFFVFSCCSGLTEGVTYIVMGSLLLIPLASKGIGDIHFLFFNYDNGMFYDMIAYLVSTTVGNMVSFVLNRKKTFKSANNVTFSVTATLIMIVFIIFYSTVLGPKLNVAIGELIPWFNTNDGTIAIRNFIGKTLMSFATFVFVFLMDKFVILRESKEQKAAAKARKAAIENGELVVETTTVVNKELAKKFLISAIVFLVVGAIGFAAGNIPYFTAHMTTPTTAIMATLIAGAVIFGVGEILMFAFVAEKLGEEKEIEPEENKE